MNPALGQPAGSAERSHRADVGFSPILWVKTILEGTCVLLAITALLILSWLVSVLVLHVANAMIHLLILFAVMVYMVHLLRNAYKT